MVDVSSRVCLHEGCRKNPSFNFAGTKKGMYCSGHRLDGMIDVKTRQCSYEGCHIFPTFNFEGSKPGKFCSRHKIPGMKDVRSKIELPCRFEGCNERPTYNFPGMKGSRYCAAHKTDGMESTVKRCKHESCNRPPTYNFEDDVVPKYCSHHKIEGMIYLSNRRKCQCEHDRCLKYPRYNYSNVTDDRGKLWGRFCEEHKKEDMVCVIKVCRFDNCGRSATHSFVDDIEPMYCGEHKMEGMIINNCKPSKYCGRDGCTSYPVYFSSQDVNTTTTSSANGYCVVHKTDEMVLRRRVCEANGCFRHPSFNYPNLKKRRYCATHKEPGMIAVSRSKLSQHPDVPQRGADNNSHDEEDGVEDDADKRKRRISEVNSLVVPPTAPSIKRIVLNDEMSFNSEPALKPKPLGCDHIPLAHALLMAVNTGYQSTQVPSTAHFTSTPTLGRPASNKITEFSKEQFSTSKYSTWSGTDPNKDSVSV